MKYIKKESVNCVPFFLFNSKYTVKIFKQKNYCQKYFLNINYLLLLEPIWILINFNYFPN
jgi:hypothetical protein